MEITVCCSVSRFSRISTLSSSSTSLERSTAWSVHRLFRLLFGAVGTAPTGSVETEEGEVTEGKSAEIHRNTVFAGAFLKQIPQAIRRNTVFAGAFLVSKNTPSKNTPPTRVELLWLFFSQYDYATTDAGTSIA